MDDTNLKPFGLRGIFLLSILIGILTGIAAWGFRLLIGLIHNLTFFGEFSPVYDANQHTAASPLGAFIILVPVIGGIVVVWLVENFAPEAKGHGVPEVMNAIHHKRGRIRGTVSVVKAVASSITIGTGGSLGREGPIVQIGSALSSAVAQWLRLSVNQRNLMIACGASGGIAATFNAPLGGILFSVELLLLSVNSRTILPVVMSSVIAANVGRYLIGPAPAFEVPAIAGSLPLENPFVLLMYFPFAAIVGLLSLIFIKGVYWSEDTFERLPLGPYSRHMLGTLLLGTLFYSTYRVTGHYYVQGVGYAAIQDILTQVLQSPWLILGLVFAKFAATLLTLGSGGSGGVFSPSLFLGAAFGGFFGGTLAVLMPELGADPATFALVGMAAMVAATVGAPMTAAIMTYEMTLNYSVVLPIMVGVSIAYAVRHYFSEGDIYTIKLSRRNLSVPQGLLADINSQIIVEEIMDSDIDFVQRGELVTGGEKYFCVVENERVVGVVNPMSYRIGHEFYPEQVMHTNFMVSKPGMAIREVLLGVNRHNCEVGIVSTSGAVDSKDVIGAFSAARLTRVFASSSEKYI